MRCDTIRRELSAPSGDLDPSALADHLDACPRCASWSTRVRDLDRLWAITRPEEPSAEAFQDLWATVMAEADAPELVAVPWSPRRRRWGMAALAGAQAAAFLMAGLLALDRRPSPVVAKVYEFRAEGGTTLIVRLDGPRGVVPSVLVSDPATANGAGPDMVAADLDVLNYMESL